MEWMNRVIKEEPPTEDSTAQDVEQEWPYDEETEGGPVKQEPATEFVSVPCIKQEESSFWEESDDDVFEPKVEIKEDFSIEKHNTDVEEQSPWEDESSPGTHITAENVSSSYMPCGMTESSNPLPIGHSLMKSNTKEMLKFPRYIKDAALHVNNSGEKYYKCDECGKCFEQRRGLTRHLKVHTNEKIHKCEECGKSFGRRGNLNDHVKIHSGKNSHKCEECGKCFSRRSYLTDHLTVHAGENLHKCEQCGKCYSQRFNLARHMKIHAGEKLYKCEECGKCFSQRRILTDHFRIHSGEKPFKCEVCGKCFSRQDTLTAHLRIHSGEKPYKCEECGKGFSQRFNLARHVKIHR